MNTSVVFRLARGLQAAGLGVLRFNFRGVGQSQGGHDGQGGEELDLESALDHLQACFPDLELWAAGFSFGARTAAAHAVVDNRVRRVVLVALPVAAFDASFLPELTKPGLILMAEHDEFGNLSELESRFPDLHPELERDEIPGVEHFFKGQTKQLQERVRAYAVRSLGDST